MERIIRRQKRRTLRVSLIAAAALLIISLITMRLFFVAEKEPTLAFVTSPGTQFAITHSKSHDTLEGMVMEKGSRLQVSHGVVELNFSAGVKAIVSAPADLTLHNDNALFLNHGVAWFRVSPKAIGFQVKTPDMQVTDLGTEFGIISSHNTLDEVHVFDGKVEVINLNSLKHKELLVAKQARIAGPAGRLKATPTRTADFRKKLPIRHLPTIVFQDQFNSGRAAWIARGSVDFAKGDYASSTCKINTSGKDDHSDVHFDHEGKEIPAQGKSFVALGNVNTLPVNTISTTIPVIAGKTYTIYFRYAGSHNDKQRIMGTMSIGSESASTGRLEAPDKAWASASFTFSPKTSGEAILKFEDTGSSEGERSDPLLDSVLVTSLPNISLPSKKQ